MEAQEIRMGEHIGVLLVYEMPDTVKNTGDRSAGICGHLGYPDGSAEIPATFGRLLRTGFHGK